MSEIGKLTLQPPLSLALWVALALTGVGVDVRVATFAGTISAADARDLESRNPDGQITDLATAISGSLADDRPQGQSLFLLSDGIHNGEGGVARVLAAARLAKAIACPVYTR